MKIKLSLIALLVVALAYTSCKKSNDNTGPALTAKQVSSQIALNLSQTLYDGFGAFSITNGLNAPGTLGLVKTKNGLRVNVTGDPLCGTIADTTFNYTTSENGVSASVMGELKFSFNCTAGVLSGFNVFDNLTIAESNSSLSINYKLAEDLTLVSQNPSADNSNITLNGTLSMDGSYTNKTGSKGSGTGNYNYTFNSIIIDSTGDIASGTASFTTSGTGPNGVWNYSGTVTFLGNYQAKIVINGATYNVNIQTGVVS